MDHSTYKIHDKRYEKENKVKQQQYLIDFTKKRNCVLSYNIFMYNNNFVCCIYIFESYIFLYCIIIITVFCYTFVCLYICIYNVYISSTHKLFIV